MNEKLDRYAFLVGLNYKNEITNQQLDELHKLYHEIADILNTSGVKR